MPIGTIIGIHKRSGVKKETGEFWESTKIHYTHKVNEKDMIGVGAGNATVYNDKFDISELEIGSVYLIEKNDSGYIENFEFIAPAKKQPEAGKPEAKS